MINNSIGRMLLSADTALVRFWFAFGSLGWAMELLFDPDYASAHRISSLLGNPMLLGCLFLVHAFSLLYGVKTHRYSKVFLFTEGVLGVFLWTNVAYVETVIIGGPGPSVFAAMVALFLLVRYPTHYTAGEKR